MNLALCDFAIVTSLIPENIVSFLMGGVWQFGDLACQIHAFCGKSFLMAIAMVAAIYCR